MLNARSVRLAGAKVKFFVETFVTCRYDRYCMIFHIFIDFRKNTLVRIRLQLKVCFMVSGQINCRMRICIKMNITDFNTGSRLRARRR